MTTALFFIEQRLSLKWFKTFYTSCTRVITEHSLKISIINCLHSDCRERLVYKSLVNHSVTTNRRDRLLFKVD